MGKWTDQGFVANTAAFYEEQLQKVFQDAFGTDFVLDKTTPQGIFITRLTELLYNMDMDGIEAFSRLNPNSATGIYLDLIGGLRSVSRNTGTPQLATIKVTSQERNFIPFSISAGTKFNDLNTGDTFVAQSILTVNTPEATIVLASASNGNTEAVIGDKLQVSGYGQIIDMEVTKLSDGLSTESDLEYRARLQGSQPVARNTIEFVQNKLLELGYVKTVGHNYNDTDSAVDILGPYSTEWMAVPKPGTDIENVFIPEVAKIILNNKMPGAPTAGNTTTTVADVFGTEKEVKFTIPTAIELEIEVRVTTPETTGVLDLVNVPEHVIAISEYINSLTIGKEVSYSRCIAPLAADKGFDIQWFKIRKKGDEQWQENSNYSIALREYASIAPSDIIIGV